MKKPTEAEVHDAVRTMLAWAGDDPSREGLIETPKRVAEAYKEFFAGYETDPEEILEKTFEEVEGYDEMVLVKDIRVESHCEHHIAPFIGKVWVAYLPSEKVCGLSKLARVVDIFAKRLQNQEMLTRQIAESIHTNLNAKGVAVAIDAVHHCMTTRGVHKHGASTVTTHFLGEYEKDVELQHQFLNVLNRGIK